MVSSAFSGAITDGKAALSSVVSSPVLVSHVVGWIVLCLLPVFDQLPRAITLCDRVDGSLSVTCVRSSPEGYQYHVLIRVDCCRAGTVTKAGCVQFVSLTSPVRFSFCRMGGHGQKGLGAQVSFSSCSAAIRWDG